MIPLGIALQIYSLRSIYEENPLLALRKVREMGYSAVEFYGNHFKAEFYRGLLEETGLVPAGWHISIDELKNNFEEVVKKSLAIGNHTLCVPYFDAPCMDDWKRFADTLNSLAARLAPCGIRTGYHTHAHDHRELAPGVTPWDIVAENTEKAVILQLDLGNAASAGIDAFQLLTKYEQRSFCIHCKPYSGEKGFFTAIGEDDIPWEKVLAFAREKGETKWLIVEYEEDDPLAVCHRSFAYLDKLQKN